MEKRVFIEAPVMFPTGVALAAIHFMVLLEWLFFVTKPSFLTSVETTMVVMVLFLAPLVPCIGIGLPIFLLATAGQKIRAKSAASLCGHLACGLVSVLMAGWLVLLFDNFTYSTAQIGISTTDGARRLAYTAGFLVAAGVLFWFVRWKSRRLSPMEFSRLRIGMGIFLGVSPIAHLVYGLSGGWTKESIPDFPDLASENLPNIVILASDGIDADALSVYGYEHETSPFLESVRDQFLFCENAFTNSGFSTPSDISLLTGIYPLDTGVLYWPDVLMGVPARRHLPGLLENAGFESCSIGMRNYVDPFDWNMLNGFDQVNGRGRGALWHFLVSRRVSGDETSFFLYQINDRLLSRVQHIFYLRDLREEFFGLDESLAGWADSDRREMALDWLANTSSPFMLHLHLLGTHGPIFAAREAHFALEEETPAYPLKTRERDDSLLDFDRFIREVWEVLEARNILEETILVITSDHSNRRHPNERIPLMIRFPGAEHAGIVENNVQLLDVAPTLVEALGESPPEWMRGQSLLSDVPDKDRPLFSTSVDMTKGLPVYRKRAGGLRQYLAPPFYEFKAVRAVIGEWAWILDTRDGTFRYLRVGGFEGPPTQEVFDHAHRVLMDRAREYNLEVGG